MKIIVTCAARGFWYPDGAERLRKTLQDHHSKEMDCGEIEFRPWVNMLPPGAVERSEAGWDFSGYIMKPHCLWDALKDPECDVAILLDAAFYCIRPIWPLIEHIRNTGYFLADNGFMTGSWLSDRALCLLGEREREPWMTRPECTSYAVGISKNDAQAVVLAANWRAMSLLPGVFEGPHTAEWGEGRNKGFVSHDKRVLGSRHDQTALAVLAHRYGLTNFVRRPRFTAYKAGYGGHSDETTVFENEGM